MCAASQAKLLLARREETILPANSGLDSFLSFPCESFLLPIKVNRRVKLLGVPRHAGLLAVYQVLRIKVQCRLQPTDHRTEAR
jgi:hypothetical protein